MAVWFASLLSLGLSISGAPEAAFSHKVFCDAMRGVASQPAVQPGTQITRFVRHGGVSVNCDERIVEIRTLLSRPIKAMGKGWLRTQMKYWRDDNCSDPFMAQAIAQGWTLKAVIVVGTQEAASFTASCGN